MIVGYFFIFLTVVAYQIDCLSSQITFCSCSSSFMVIFSCVCSIYVEYDYSVHENRLFENSMEEICQRKGIHICRRHLVISERVHHILLKDPCERIY